MAEKTEGRETKGGGGLKGKALTLLKHRSASVLPHPPSTALTFSPGEAQPLRDLPTRNCSAGAEVGKI